MKKKKKLLLILLLIVVICSIGGAYAFFYYFQEEHDVNLIKMGNINFNFEEIYVSPIRNVSPMSDSEARINGYYTDNFSDTSYSNNIKVFSISGVNDYTDQDIEYKIILEHDGDVYGKTRMNDWDVVFDLVEGDQDTGFKYLIKGEGYTDFDGLCIYTGRLTHNDGEFTKTFTIRSWVNENTLISQTNPYAEYTGNENLFYGYKIKIVAELKEPIKKQCSILWDMNDTKGTSYSGYSECDNYSELVSLLTDNSVADWDNVKSLKINYDLNDTEIDFDFYTWQNNSNTFMTKLVNLDIRDLKFDNIRSFNIYNAVKLKNIVGLNTINTTNKFYGMSRAFGFKGSDAPNSDMRVVKINNWNFNRVSSLASAFIRSGAMIINLPKNLNNRKISFNNAFRFSNVRYLDFSGWNIKTNGIGSVFYGAKYLDSIDLSSFDLSESGAIDHFAYDSNLSSIKFDGHGSSNITDTSYAFSKMPRLESIDLSSFDFSGVTTCNNMFEDTESLSIVYGSSSTSFSNCTTGSDMFKNSGLIGERGNKPNSVNTDKTYAHVDAYNNVGYFTDKPSKACNIYYSLSDTTNYDRMISCTGLSDIVSKLGSNSVIALYGPIKSLKIIYRNDSRDAEPFQSANSLFTGLRNSLVRVDLSDFDTSEFYTLSGMFDSFSNLVSVDLSGFDTRKVTSMSMMFYGCSSLKEIDLRSFTTGNVFSVDGMFRGCRSLERIIGTLDMSNVDGFSNMFNGCNVLTYVDLSGFTSKISIGIGMFKDCLRLRTIDLSNLDFSEAADLSSMFESSNSYTNVLFEILVNDTLPNSVYAPDMFKNDNYIRNYNSNNYSGDKFNTTDGYVNLLT